MAKMFYTMDETKAALGQGEEAVKQFIREGRLREFRDGPRLMFKADQVDALKSQIGGGALELAGDSGAPIGLADTGGGSGIGLSLADSIGSGIAGGSGLTGISGSGLAGSGLAGSSGAGSGMMNIRDDTALAADLGLSGTMGGLTSGNRSKSGSLAGGSLSGGSLAGGSLSGGSLGGSLGGGTLGGGSLGGGSLGGGSLGGGSLGGGSLGGGSLGATGTLSGTGSGSRQGINVFGDDSQAGADPMAQTAIPGPGGSDLNLEGVGSGSGLLDLTRESDETSLGAELLDEIPRGAGGSRPLAPPDTGSMAGIPMATGGGIVRGGLTAGPIVVEARDTTAGAFGGLALGGAAVLLFGLFALMTASVGVTPEYVAKVAANGFWIVFAIGAGVALLFFVFGLLIAKSVRR